MDATGLVTQCMHCRRVRAPVEPERWDFVPAFVAQAPEPVSHGMCGPCFEVYYRPLQQRR